MKSIWLENLDLSEAELKVMNVLQEIKLVQNVTFIAQKANLPRSTTLYILRKFLKRGLARRVPRIGPRRNGKGIKRFHWRKADIVILK